MIKVENMDSIAPGNPFYSDLFHVGTKIGTNVMIMHRSLSEKEREKYIIVVNIETGERILIRFDDDVTHELEIANAVQSIKEEKGEEGGATFETETVKPRTKEEIARDLFYGKEVNRG